MSDKKNETVTLTREQFDQLLATRGNASPSPTLPGMSDVDIFAARVPHRADEERRREAMHKLAMEDMASTDTGHSTRGALATRHVWAVLADPQIGGRLKLVEGRSGWRVVGLDRLELHPDLRLGMMRAGLAITEPGLADEVIALELGTFDAARSRFGYPRVASVHVEFFKRKKLIAQDEWNLKKLFHQLVGAHEAQAKRRCGLWIEAESDAPPAEYVERMKPTGTPAEVPPTAQPPEPVPMPREMAADYAQDVDRRGAPRRV